METVAYVAVKTGRSGASFLRRTVPEATAWGEYSVVSMAIWQETLLRNGTTVLGVQDEKAWKDVSFVGECSYGVWLKGASKIDVLRVTNTAHFVKALVHLPENAYSDLRRRSPVWWKKAVEQKGWSLVPPPAMMWQRCAEPTPEETKLYMESLRRGDWDSTVPSESKRFESLRELCDPSGKLLALAKSTKK